MPYTLEAPNFVCELTLGPIPFLPESGQLRITHFKMSA